MRQSLRLGDILKKARRTLGLSQKQVAQHLGLKSGQSISDWERLGGSGIPHQNLKKLIHLYSLNAQEILEHYIEGEKGRLEEKLRKRFK